MNNNTDQSICTQDAEIVAAWNESTLFTLPGFDADCSTENTSNFVITKIPSFGHIYPCGSPMPIRQHMLPFALPVNKCAQLWYQLVQSPLSIEGVPRKDHMEFLLQDEVSQSKIARVSFLLPLEPPPLELAGIGVHASQSADIVNVMLACSTSSVWRP
jgi:hypothetical protein